ncbi:MAG: 16S rRNA (guanine(966)-N(2))-methyltransferase RsmD [Planctomycetota bacterium]
MRIISGKAKGIQLSALNSKQTRPILDRAKESLFNILGDSLPDSVVLDLFAGTGSLGIEALSRDAKRCLFVDNSTNAIRVIKKNLQDTGFLKKTVVLKINAFRLLGFLKNKHIKFDLILVAPPYKLLDIDCRDRKRIFSLLDECVSREIINEKGIIVLQHHKKQMVSQESFKQLKVIDERRYGTTQLTFLGTNSASNPEMQKS